MHWINDSFYFSRSRIICFLKIKIRKEKVIVNYLKVQNPLLLKMSNSASLTLSTSNLLTYIFLFRKRGERKYATLTTVVYTIWATNIFVLNLILKQPGEGIKFYDFWQISKLGFRVHTICIVSRVSKTISTLCDQRSCHLLCHFSE